MRSFFRLAWKLSIAALSKHARSSDRADATPVSVCRVVGGPRVAGRSRASITASRAFSAPSTRRCALFRSASSCARSRCSASSAARAPSRSSSAASRASCCSPSRVCPHVAASRLTPGSQDWRFRNLRLSGNYRCRAVSVSGIIIDTEGRQEDPRPTQRRVRILRADLESFLAATGATPLRDPSDQRTDAPPTSGPSSWPRRYRAREPLSPPIARLTWRSRSTHSSPPPSRCSTPAPRKNHRRLPSVR